ncbi:hypothetical protein [Streptomyces sp. NPDC088196]|uniref:hypothetical protein n=1 Tax=Streptomyces sp. NPDC088196 TaxID=3154868 RepID=UPI00344C7154
MDHDRDEEDFVFLLAKGVVWIVVVLLGLCALDFIWNVVGKFHHFHAHPVTAQSALWLALSIVGVVVAAVVIAEVVDRYSDNRADAQLEERCRDLEEAARTHAQESYDQMRAQLEREYAEFRSIINE